jgi:predicted peptidase
MKRSLLFMLMLCASAIILSSSLLVATGKAPAAKKQSATVVFNEPVKLLNVVLKGEYLIVHDDSLMARGENCTFVYSLKGDMKTPVVSFHCTPVPRAEVKNFTVRTERVSPGAMSELREFQFAGSSESHLVPLK